MSNIPLHTAVTKQIPEFIRSQYPLFVEFIEAYYAYQDEYEYKDIQSLRDIDETLDSFIQYFKNELDIYGTTYPYIDQRLFLRKAKELFTKKGVEEAYKFLFKILYNKTADVSYPWKSVLIPSSGQWQQDISIFVDTTGSTADINTLPGNRIDINGPNQIIKVIVVRVNYVRDNIYEIFIDRNYYGDIKTGYTVTFTGVTGKIIPTTVSYYIANPGNGFRVGDLIVGNTISNGSIITQKLKVTAVNNVGGVTAVTNIEFGCGYTTDFYLLQSNQAISTPSTLQIDKDGTTQYSLNNDSIINQFADYGYIINPNYDETDYQDPTYVGEILQQFYQEANTSKTVAPNYLLIGFTIGAVAKYQGYYSSNNGFLDDDIVIQDSYKYQKYSYIVTVNERLSDYINILKSYLHPAGTALFGEFQIQNTYGPIVGATNEVGQWRSQATFTTINIPTITDYLTPGTGSGLIGIDPYDSQVYMDPSEHCNPPETHTFTG